jgi:hypothetical protein
VCCCPWHSIWRGSLCICYCLFILKTTSMFLENFPTLDVTSYLLLGANAWEWWYKIQLSRCIWICDVIQRIQVSWANQMWIYLLKLFKWTVLKFQRCQLQSTKLYLFVGWSCFIISEGKIWKKIVGLHSIEVNWPHVFVIMQTVIEISYFATINFVTTYNYIICNYFYNYELPLRFLQLSYDYIITIGGFMFPCGWFLCVFSFKNMVENPIRHITN